MNVVTRFAPSPTGFLHVGGARTALFNWLLARHFGGKFILRIEDTDLQRNQNNTIQEIIESLNWLGMNYDEGPYFQSQRFDLYNEHVDRMLASRHAYWCECTPEEVESMREEARAKGLKPKYASRCRERGLGPGPGRCVRLKTPLDGATVVDDLIKGPVRFDHAELDDMIIRRTDGSPTYNLAVVVDDALMGMTHILRGDDHLNNTPRQILLYQALGYPVPRFGHVPMILGPDKKKLSKRHGAESVMEYKEMGYLPETLINYLARLGWAHGDQEIFSCVELIDLFNINNLGNAAAVFDHKKLKWLNQHYIKKANIGHLADLLNETLAKRNVLTTNKEYLENIVPLFQSRVATITEMAEKAEFFLVSDDDLEIDVEGKKLLTPEFNSYLKDILNFIQDVDWSVTALESTFNAYLEKTNIKFKFIAQPLRVILTGKISSPGLFETMLVLGRKKCIARINKIIS